MTDKKHFKPTKAAQRLLDAGRHGDHEILGIGATGICVRVRCIRCGLEGERDASTFERHGGGCIPCQSRARREGRDLARIEAMRAMRHGDGYRQASLEEVGERFGITRERVRQLLGERIWTYGPKERRSKVYGPRAPGDGALRYLAIGRVGAWTFEGTARPSSCGVHALLHGICDCGTRARVCVGNLDNGRTRACVRCGKGLAMARRAHAANAVNAAFTDSE